MTTLGTWNNPGLLAPRLLTNCPQLFVSPPCVARSCSSMSPPHQAKAYFRDRWHLLLTKRVTASSYFCKHIVPLPPIERYKLYQATPIEKSDLDYHLKVAELVWFSTTTQLRIRAPLHSPATSVRTLIKPEHCFVRSISSRTWLMEVMLLSITHPICSIGNLVSNFQDYKYLTDIRSMLTECAG